MVRRAEVPSALGRAGGAVRSVCAHAFECLHVCLSVPGVYMCLCVWLRVSICPGVWVLAPWPV